MTLASTPGKAWLLHETARLLGPDAVIVHVPRDLDKTAYVLLSAAAQCGAEPLQKTAAQLAAHQADPSEALDVLASALGHRPLLVADLDALEGAAADGELRDVFAPSLRKVSAWLQTKASVITRTTTVGDETRMLLDGPRASNGWDSQLVWKRVGGDVELYTLAVARVLLLGVPLDDHSLGWDVDSIIGDLWDGTTHDVRQMITLLAVHGRPFPRRQLDGLGLVSAAAIDVGIRSHLVEPSRDLLRLTASSVWLGLLSPPERIEGHRRLAKAFAHIAHEATSLDAAPLAVLEAHRHYAAVPDIEQARQFARFGVQMLLVSAKQMSADARYTESLYDRSSRTYDLVLQLDEQVRAAGDAGGIGTRARAYAIHYRAYNRYKAGAEGPLETLAAYREALSVWPQNALFWSRTIGGCFVAGRYEEGMRARDDALTSVPKHPQRSAFVIVRTAEHLLRRDLVLAAVLVWRDYQAENFVAQEVGADLRERLAKGWSERRLWARAVPSLAFRRPVHVRITAAERLFECHLGGLVAQGSSPEAALSTAMRDFSAELLDVLEDPSPSPERSARKHELVTITDFEAMRSSGEPARWRAYLASLEGLVAQGDVTEAQHRRLLETWKRARGRFPGLKRPAIGRADGRLCLGWSFGDPKGVTLTIDIERDGRVDWFYRNATESQVSGTEDEPESELSEEALSLLAPFSR